MLNCARIELISYRVLGVRAAQVRGGDRAEFHINLADAGLSKSQNRQQQQTGKKRISRY